MKTFKVQITADRYPTEYEVQAASWHTAIARAVKKWRQRFKGERIDHLRILAVKVK